MKYSVISFDLQGTLSDARFSDYFWMETLPYLHSEKNNISIEESKKQLKEYFKKIGEYDYRYYSVDFWMKNLGKNFDEIFKLIKYGPLFYQDSIDLINDLKLSGVKLIITSSTTYDFINIELGKNRKYFDHVFSSLDDFNIAGKPVRLYNEISEKLKVESKNIIHIGDCSAMDVANAKKAGWDTFYFDKSEPRGKIIAEIITKITSNK